MRPFTCFTFYELVNELTSIPFFSLGPSFTSIPNGKAQRKVKMWQLGENILRCTRFKCLFFHHQTSLENIVGMGITSSPKKCAICWNIYIFSKVIWVDNLSFSSELKNWIPNPRETIKKKRILCWFLINWWIAKNSFSKRILIVRKGNPRRLAGDLLEIVI